MVLIYGLIWLPDDFKVTDVDLASGPFKGLIKMPNLTSKAVTT